jgi:hypothetical protein
MTTHTHNGTEHYLKCNGKPRELVAGYELPEGVHAEWFDYVPAESDDFFSTRFFEYRGSWYDTREFEHVRDGGIAKDLGFHGMQGESYFSAVLIRYTEDYESVIVGYLHW